MTGATEATGNGQVGTHTFNIGVTTITYTVTDAANRTNTCAKTITVSDVENPTISCGSNQSANTASGLCTASVAVTDVTFDDNCTGEAISWIMTGATEANGNGQVGTYTFNKGITTITYTVTDASTNTNTCFKTVTVTDNEAPSVSCPDNIIVPNAPGQCTASVAVGTITATDNCPGQTISWSTTGATTLSGTGQIGTKTFNVGVTTVNVTVTDAANHTAQCSFTVTVNDTQKPVISGCPSNITRTSSAGQCTATVSWTEPTATDNCTPSGSLVWTKSHTPGSVFPVGTTTVTYTVKDASNNVSDDCVFTVTVTDNQKPVISGCPTNITAYTGPGASSCNTTVSWTEPTATDNCTASQDLVWTNSHTPGTTFNVGNTTVTYTVRDEANNVSNPCTFTITVVDNTPPVALCKPATLYLNSSGNATLTVGDVNNGSTDNCTAQGSLQITLSKTSFNCSNVGPNTVVMTVKDAAGNQATCNATVTVVDNIPPVMTATAGMTSGNVNANSGACTYTVNGSEYDPTVSDNCSGVVRSYTVTGATTLSGTGSLAGKVLNKGANLITWNATDASGNPATPALSFTKTVVDNQAPVISAKSNQTRNTNTGICGYTTVGDEFNVTATDNCALTSLTYNLTGATTGTGTDLAGKVFNTGTTTVTWTASDGTLSSTRTVQVIVTDNVAPVIPQQSNLTSNINSGCGAVVSWTTPTPTDNCGIASFSQVQGPPSGSTFPVGVTTIRYSATDVNGNIATMQFTVTVSDQTAPDITCPSGSPFSRNAGIGVCFYTVSGTEFDATATDGCPGNLVVTNSFDGSTSLAGKQIPVGTHAIVWTATDGTNTSTCTITVTVNDTQDPVFTQPSASPYTRFTDPGKCYFTVPGTNSTSPLSATIARGKHPLM